MKKLKLVSLGGFGKVTRNLFVYEYDNQVLIVDAGIGFPDTPVYGIDYLLPDISYLVNFKTGRPKKKVVGILLSHGHEDHIGAMPYIYKQLGSPKIYTSPLAAGLVRAKFDEFKIKAEFKILTATDRINIGPFEIETVAVTHSIPDTYHFFIRTPVGTIYHGTDFKFDDRPVIGPKADKERISQLAKKEKVLLLLSDCLRVDRLGRTPSEESIQNKFLTEVSNTRGRFFMTTFSSNLDRFQQAINVSLQLGRHIVPVGRSIQTVFKVAKKLKYLNLPQEMVLDPETAMSFPVDKLTYLIGGSQGQIDSSLSRVATGRHPFIKVDKGDKVIFSSDAIPGNEVNVYRVIDSLMKKGADVLYPEISDELYVSGHASRDELVELVSLVKPQYLLPIGGQYRHLITYKRVMMKSFGYRADNIIIPDSGQFIDLSQNQVKLAKKIRLKDVVVDGSGIGDVGTVILEERRTMAQAGLVFVLFLVKNGVVTGVELFSRGFVFRPRSQDLFTKAKFKLEDFIGWRNISQDFYQKVSHRLERFFYKKMKRQPLIMVDVLEMNNIDKHRTIG